MKQRKLPLEIYSRLNEMIQADNSPESIKFFKENGGLPEGSTIYRFTPGNGSMLMPIVHPMKTKNMHQVCYRFYTLLKQQTPLVTESEINAHLVAELDRARLSTVVIPILLSEVNPDTQEDKLIITEVYWEHDYEGARNEFANVYASQNSIPPMLITANSFWALQNNLKNLRVNTFTPMAQNLGVPIIFNHADLKEEPKISSKTPIHYFNLD